MKISNSFETFEIFDNFEIFEIFEILEQDIRRKGICHLPRLCEKLILY